MRTLVAILVLLGVLVVGATGQFVATGTAASSSGGSVNVTVTGVTGSNGAAALAVSVGGCTGTGTLQPRSTGHNPNGTEWGYYGGELKLCDGSVVTIRLLLGHWQDPAVGNVMISTPSTNGGSPTGFAGSIT